MTRQEEISKELKEIKDSIVASSGIITKRFDKLDTDLKSLQTQLETKIENDLQSLENRFDQEIKLIRESKNKLSLHVDKYNESFETDILELKGQNEQRDIHDSSTDDKLSGNEYTINSLKKKIVSLEKAVHGGLQHSRKYNLEFDGIPLEVEDTQLERILFDFI